MAGRGVNWSLEELVDFEVALKDPSAPNAEIGQEMRRDMRGMDGFTDETPRRRWGLKYWLLWVRGDTEVSVGRRLVTVSPRTWRASMAVRIGCDPVTRAEIPTGNPTFTDENTPPR